MSWLITPSNLLVDDADAMTYLAAVEAADGQALESGVRLAVNAFVKGCKADGIWPAIKASCIMAGARTLAGCLVPLVGTAPTNFNFVAGDYNRKTGLKGNGTNKYLNSNITNSSLAQNNIHMAARLSEPTQATSAIMGSAVTVPALVVTQIIANGTDYQFTANSSSGYIPVLNNYTNLGLVGVSRSNASALTARINQITYSNASNASVAPNSYSIFVMSRNLDGSTNIPSVARLSFYSIGESLDLALLDTRVSNLMTALAAAIP